jgi:phosphoglycolate phosphatase-like HAD superfamily hydrolase
LKDVREDEGLASAYRAARCIFFDCDGVIFDSNGFKIEAMHSALFAYGAAERERMEAFWRQNGGVSRYEKFGHFFSQIAPVADVAQAVAQAAERFGAHSRSAYSTRQPVAAALKLARDAGRERCFVVSGADQAELVDVFAEKGLSGSFAGVYGSPTAKLTLVTNVLEALGCTPAEALLIGDGAGDFRVCRALNMRFVYLAQYSEWRGAREALQDAPRVAWANNWDELLHAFGV